MENTINEVEEVELTECVRCSERVEDTTETADGEVCSECIDRYGECGDCGDLYLNDSMFGIGGHDYCEHCRNNLPVCNMCGDRVEEVNEFGNCIECEDEDEEVSSSQERRYSKGNEFATGSGRVYAVEIECNFPNYQERARLFREIDEAVGITHDGSLGSYGVELQTPKLNGTRGNQLLQSTLKHLNESGFTVDTRCGLHVHLDTSDYFQPLLGERSDIEYYTMQKIKRLMLFYLVFEPVIYSFLPISRRTNRYCYPLGEFYHIKEVENLDDLDGLEKLWYRAQSKNEVDNRKCEKYDSSRYAGFNFHSMLANQHIEARHHSGTLSYTKIRNWVDLNVLILDYVIKAHYNRDMMFTEKLNNAKALLNLEDKTEAFFEMIGANKKLVRYFKTRQAKFSKGSFIEQSKQTDN